MTFGLLTLFLSRIPQQLQNWFRNRNRKRDRKEGRKLLTTIIAVAQPARTRAPKVVESYQKMYKEKISTAVSERMDELEAAGAPKGFRRTNFLEVNNAVRDYLWDAEEECIRERVEEQHKKEVEDGSGSKPFSKSGSFGQ